VARPRAKIDPDQLEALAKIQCSNAEISAVLKVSLNTLERRFGDRIRALRETGKASLRRSQFQQAMKGNTTMLVFLGKQYLGQTDKQTVDQTITVDNRKIIEERKVELLKLLEPIKDSSGNEL
jgi:hypothetical protein